jgi:hypothetical protein
MVLRRKVRWLVVLVCVCLGATPAAASAKKAKKPPPAPSGGTTTGTTAGASGTGTRALWHMDETSGSTMTDASGNGHNGTLSSIKLGVAPGFSGTAYGFSRSTVTVPSASDLNPGSQTITTTIHVKTTSAPATPDWDLFRKGQYTTAGGEWKMEYQPSGQASCGFKGSNGYSELMAGPSLKNGQWHAVSCRKTSTQIQVIVDGQMFSKTANIGTIANSAPVIMGSYPGAEFFQGTLDEASIVFG